MRVRVLLAGQLEPLRGEASQAVFVEVEAGVLARDKQRRRDPPFGEGAGDRSQFDRFRSGPDNQPDIPGMQPSP